MSWFHYNYVLLTIIDPDNILSKKNSFHAPDNLAYAECLYSLDSACLHVALWLLMNKRTF